GGGLGATVAGCVCTGEASGGAAAAFGSVVMATLAWPAPAFGLVAGCGAGSRAGSGDVAGGVFAAITTGRASERTAEAAGGGGPGVAAAVAGADATGDSGVPAATAPFRSREPSTLRTWNKS